MTYDTGLLAWLRSLPERQPKNQIDTREAIDERFSAIAVAEGLVTLRELTNYQAESDRAYVVLVVLTPLGERALRENP